MSQQLSSSDSSEGQGVECVPWGRISATLGVLLPFGYFGMLLGVTIHEVIGHGMTSLAVGGRFDGFYIALDGMGYAIVPSAEDAEPWRDVVVSSGGVISTTVSGLLLLSVASGFRQSTWIALPLLVVAYPVLMDGIPYAFWNSVNPGPPGDLGYVLALIGSDAVRWALVILSGTLMVTCIWAWTAALYLGVQCHVTHAQELKGRAKWTLLGILGVLPGAGWFLFDWNQLVEGIGHVPNVVGLSLHLAAAATVGLIRFSPLRAHSFGGIRSAALVGWSLGIASTVVVASWLRHGVYFNSV